MKYLLMVCVDESIQSSPEESAAEVKAATAWAQDTQARGVRVLGDRLRPTKEATTVRVRDGELLVSDGPFAETKEQLAGFDVIECASLDEAVQVASAHPGAQIGTVELRPFWHG
ncbi:YciI family protein [Plantactinospora soyae]|uniref:YciI family protein n=1 Tax=Plantactinospora soyae TaxID=1544732 RepID=UPI00298F3826|nr:YciI family protein [Plantactinospora soyae]